MKDERKISQTIAQSTGTEHFLSLGGAGVGKESATMIVKEVGEEVRATCFKKFQ